MTVLNTWRRLQHVQKSQVAFIAFTIIQILLFIFLPSVYDEIAKGLEGPPLYAAYRLIGSKEIGLMAIYTAGAVANDWNLATMTVIGRSTTIFMFSYMIFMEGAPWVLIFAIVQDVVGAAITGYFILTERRKPARYMVTIRQSHSLLPRAVILLSGMFEIYFGVGIFRKPLSRRLVESPLFGAPNYINLQLFGYMSILLGLYQIGIACMKEADLLSFLAVAFHHLNFYLTTTIVIAAVTGQTFTPPSEHLWCGWAVLILTLLAVLVDRLAQFDKDRKRQ